VKDAPAQTILRLYEKEMDSPSPKYLLRVLF